MEQVHAKILCKYADKLKVSESYTRDYLGNAKFGEEVLVSTLLASDVREKK